MSQLLTATLPFMCAITDLHKFLLAGLGVFSSWLGGLPGWLSGGWWLERKNKTEREVNDLKSKELSNGRLAM